MSRKPTDFEMRVYTAASRVPRGRVTTYALLGQAIGCSSARAVGQALKRNPFAPDVPCHRVIASDLSLGGFRGHRGTAALEDKAKLLMQEGVALRNGRLVDRDRVYGF